MMKCGVGDGDDDDGDEAGDLPGEALWHTTYSPWDDNIIRREKSEHDSLDSKMKLQLLRNHNIDKKCQTAELQPEDR